MSVEIRAGSTDLHERGGGQSTMSAKPRSQGSLNALAALIDRVRRERGLSLRAVARGGGLAVSTVAALAQPGRVMRQIPFPSTIDGLAAGLGVPVGDVRHAAAAAVHGQRVETYTVRVGDTDLEVRAALGDGQDGLTDEEIARVAAYAAGLLATRGDD